MAEDIGESWIQDIDLTVAGWSIQQTILEGFFLYYYLIYIIVTISSDKFKRHIQVTSF